MNGTARIVRKAAMGCPKKRVSASTLVAMMAFMFAGCAVMTGSSSPIATRLVLASKPSDETAAAALISRYRVGHGLSPVFADAKLAQAAEVQARAVASTGALSHGDFPRRMASFGVAGLAAENLSAGRASVAEAIAGWKASKGHDENLLLPGIRRIGVACVDTPGVGYGHYWALVLSR